MARLIWVLFLIETSFRNLLRSPRRTLISLLAIAAAAGAMIVFQSFVDGVQSEFRNNVITSVYGHYQISPRGFRDEANDDPLSYKIDDPEGIKQLIETEVGPLSLFAKRRPFYGLLSFNDRSVGGIGIGINAEEEKKFFTLKQVYEGKELAGSPPNSVYVGFKLAKRLRIKPGDLVTVLVTTKSGSLNALDLEVVGTFKTGVTELDQGTYQVHFEAAETILKVSGAPLVVIGFQQDNEMQYKAKLESVIGKKDPTLVVEHWRKLADFFDNTMGWIKNQVLVFRVIILVIATISIVTVFLMGLFERTGEFGTLRAIGTHRGSIAGMIFIESLFQSTLGSLLGAVLGILLISVALRGGIVMPPPPLMSVPFHVKFAIPWNDIPLTLVLCIFVAGGAGVFPAIKMARIRIIEALGRNM